MKIAVIGAGLVGLSLVAASLKHGHEVMLIDLDQSVLDRYERKMFEKEFDINKHEYEILRDNRENLKLTCEYNKKELQEIDTFFICVNTEAVISAIKYLNDYKSDKAMVLVESTIYPAMVEHIENLLHQDLFVVSPERVMEGRLLKNLYEYVKIVGARSRTAYLNAEKIYKAIGLKNGWMQEVTPEEAAMSKIVENSYRYWTIVFGHVVADIVRGTPNCDYDNVREAVNSRPDRELPFAGLGIGGACLKNNVEYLINQCITAKANVEELETKLKFETYRTDYFIPKLVIDALGKKERKILILGAAYRPNGQSTLNSPSLVVAGGIKRKFKNTYIYDSDIDDHPDVIREGLYEFIESQAIDTIILTLPSGQVSKDFERLMMRYPEMTFVNLTQWDAYHPEKLDYIWIPC